ncbi:MAG: hypothetical protein CLLPBCKN_001939 [Chroococcidiopsis cubana SAG 39.79]|nr:hypothetical protein [Chroococcidiopsis cubana SAG 39.79]
MRSIFCSGSLERFSIATIALARRALLANVTSALNLTFGIFAFGLFSTHTKSLSIAHRYGKVQERSLVMMLARWRALFARSLDCTSFD